MTAPHATPRLRPVRADEIDAVARLVRGSFERFVAPLYSREGREKFLAFRDPERIEERLRLPGAFLYVAEIEVAEIEVAEIETVSRPDAVAPVTNRLAGMIEVRDASHVTLFFVDPAYAGTGVGRALMTRAVEECRRRLPALAAVTVNSSPNAVAVYERLGFRRLCDGGEKGEDVRAGVREEVREGIRFVPMRRPFA